MNLTLLAQYPATSVTISTITYRYTLLDGYVFAVPGDFASKALESLVILHMEDFTQGPGLRYIDVWAKPNVDVDVVTDAVNAALDDSGGLVECCG